MLPQFNSYTLAEVLSDLYHGERSGVLVLAHQGPEKRIHFDRGMIVFAESSAADEDLGAVLVRDGRVSAGALAEARNAVDEEANAQELARVLVQRDLIARSVVSQAMAEIVDRVVQSAFTWEEGGQARFDESDQAAAIFETDILTTVEVILNGVFSMTGFDTVYEAMRGTESTIRLSDPVPIPVERLTLSATHGFILSRLDGQTSITDLLSILPGEEEEVAARFMFGLLVLGVVEYDPPLSNEAFRVTDLVQMHADHQALERVQEQSIRQKYEQVRQQNPYEILGVRTSATRTEIERAYEQLKSQYGRERLLPKVRDSLRSQISVIESRLVEAFLTLTQASGDGLRARHGRKAPADAATHDFAVRVELDRAKSQVEADQNTRVADTYFAKGKKCMREGDFHNAIQYGKLAISHNASDARYFCLLADCQVRNPEGRWQRMAEENYQRATQLDPWNAEYWIHLARLYQRRGMKLRAQKNYEEALKLVPNHTEILKELASLKS